VVDEVHLTLFLILSAVRHLHLGYHGAGSFEIKWDGLDDHGQPAETGVYLAILRQGDGTRTLFDSHMMLLIK
jgi:hypothetical protein